jgi:D-amino peptidase
MLCDDFKTLHPSLVTCVVKDGMGALTRNYSPEDTLKSIKELSEKALKQDLKNALVKLPSHFEVEMYYKEHQSAEKASWYPGVSKKSDNIAAFQSDSFFEVLRTIYWII